MIGGLERRLRRLERGTSDALPWGRPVRERSDEQLLAVIGEGNAVTDEYLLDLSRPDALMFGVPEKTVAAWVDAYAPGGEPCR